MLKILSILVILVMLQFNATKGASIKGRIELDDSWASVIYLSLINAFDDLNTASYDFLIYEAPFDTLGNFNMSVLELPEDDRIYRLHVCKKDDPVSTIIIGGKDENFIHFVMNNRSEIEIAPNKDSGLFKHAIVKGHAANNSLKQLFAVQNELLSPPDLPSMQNREILQEKVINSFRSFADTSSHAIIKLLSLYYMGDFFTFSGNIHFIENMAGKIQEMDSSSPYFNSFMDELEYNRYQIKNAKTKIHYGYFLAISTGIIFGLIVMYTIRRKKNRKHLEKAGSQLINSLSVQEKRVLDLLKAGKTNKEISLELHIEVSTVKSHLNKIYSRLGVKSRKEIINREQF